MLWEQEKDNSIIAAFEITSEEMKINISLQAKIKTTL